MKRCSENIQQIYSRTPMPTCDFNKANERGGRGGANKRGNMHWY